MAQVSRGEQAEEVNGSSIKRGDEEDAAEGSAGFKLNVHAPEFVPRSQLQAVPPLSGCFYPYLPFFENGCGGSALGPGWFYFAEQEPIHFIPDFHGKVAGHSKDSNDVIQKIVKQVEYQFSDTNLVANDFLMKIMNKDPQGFVPMSVVASWKKIKSLGANHHMLIKALGTSTKLALSEDGKKIRRKQLFTERDKEELQSRTVVVENLPEDYSRQNLGKLFSVVGSVKNIRICHPQEPNSATSSKSDVLINNKLHALVEYESTEQAEKAVEKLNDERNWRKGLRVRTMLRCSPKSVIRSKKLDFDHFDLYAEDDRSPSSPTLGSPRIEHLLDHSTEDNQSGSRKGRGRGRAKSHGLLLQSHSESGLLPHSPHSGGALGHGEASSKQSPQGPRMPDGTRGFAMGRGKPLSPVLGRAPSPAAAETASSSLFPRPFYFKRRGRRRGRDMRGPPLLSFPCELLALLLFLLCLQDFYKFDNIIVHSFAMVDQITEEKENALMPDISPSSAPQPFLPVLAPSPMATPFFNSSIPKLSGQCILNFSAVDSLISTTAVDCWTSFAPFLANVICCPQFQATLIILIGQSSKETGLLALDSTHANYCLSDIQQILGSQGANSDLQEICSVHPSNLSEGSCPVSDIDGFESVVDSSQLLTACGKVDPVNECCSKICQNAILEAARKLALRDGGLTTSMAINNTLIQHSSKIDSCRNIVLRWLSSRLDPSSAKQVLRRLSNCNVNGVCPLDFPDTKGVAKNCGNEIKNDTACCHAMENYVSHLQKQSFITNLQSLGCASLLGLKLQEMNVSTNIYSLCQISLKDFSLQVGTQESGCLLPSLPSDATFDPSSGISFTCDLNDNIAAPWPSASQASSSSCNKSVNYPSLPAATSSQLGLIGADMKLAMVFSLSLLLIMLL
ncbi:unnamed protein product [Musa hybrid cultivar]